MSATRVTFYAPAVVVSVVATVLVALDIVGVIFLVAAPVVAGVVAILAHAFTAAQAAPETATDSVRYGSGPTATA